MSDKKHIDRIFQEKFKDFEATPNPQVWNNIQNKLNKPKKDRKKVLPFWYKLAGVAALLLLLLTVGNLLITGNSTVNSNKTKVVDTENTMKVKNATNSSDETEINSIVANTSNEKTNKTVNGTSSSENQIGDNNSEVKGNSNTAQIASEEGLKTKSINQTTPKVSKENSNKSITNPSYKTNTRDTRLTENTKDKVESEENFDKNPTKINNNKLIGNNNNIATTQTNGTTKTENQLQQLNNKTAENGVALKENTEAELEKPLVYDLNKTDLTIEEAIAANQDLIEEEKDEIINRWQVYANIAPVYYNSMGKGSHLDQQFASNSKSGEVNTSYGINVSYNLNNKLSVRTGLSSLNLSYDTNDVILYTNIASTGSTPSPFRNINLSNGNEGLTAISADNLSVAQVDNVLSPKSNAAISQRISYYEIPMELNYRIGNKKLGFNLIAGFSSFILDGNDVYSELLGEKTYIGEANNIRSMSFSTNFGVGLDYKFTEKFKFNLEPTFKYQLNAFENTSGSFNPYIIGVYTGFSYKF